MGCFWRWYDITNALSGLCDASEDFQLEPNAGRWSVNSMGWRPASAAVANAAVPQHHVAFDLLLPTGRNWPGGRGLL